jgi:hypothetical protein
MNRRRLTGVVVALLLLAGMAPGPARAGHCNPLLVFSGFNTPAGLEAVNVGAGGCAWSGNELDTNYLTPGATHLRVGTSATPVGTGQLLIDGQPTTLTFTPPAAAGGRWNSQIIEIPVGTTHEVKATVLTATGVELTAIYRTVA